MSDFEYLGGALVKICEEIEEQVLSSQGGNGKKVDGAD